MLMLAHLTLRISMILGSAIKNPTVELLLISQKNSKMFRYIKN